MLAAKKIELDLEPEPEPEPEPEDDRILQAADAAEQELVQLRLAANEALEASNTAQRTFQDNPSEKNYTKSAVALQRAHNARDALQAKTAETQELRNAAIKIRFRREFDELAPQLNWQETFREPTQALADAIVAFTRETLLPSVAQLRGQIVQHNADAKKANGLAGTLRLPDNFPPIETNRVLNLVYDAVKRELCAGSNLNKLNWFNIHTHQRANQNPQLILDIRQEI